MPGNQVLPAEAVAIQHPHCSNFFRGSTCEAEKRDTDRD
jgi:hypothetical protein